MLDGSEVLNQTEQVQAARSQRPLSEVVVGESFQLPENDLPLLIEEGEKEFFLGAGEQSGHRESPYVHECAGVLLHPRDLERLLTERAATSELHLPLRTVGCGLQLVSQEFAQP